MRREERAFLERSLADLDAEHAAGDLSDEDYESLRARYEARLRGERVGPPAPPPRRPGFVVATVAFVAAVAVGAGILLATSVGRREAGQTLTGEDVSAPPPSDAAPPASGAALDPALAACVDLTVAPGRDGGEIIDCFQGYTRDRPDDPEGWTEFGLFVFQEALAAGGNEDLLSAGEGFLGQALAIDPGNVRARVYLAVVLERTGRLDDAAAALAALEGAEVPSDLAPLVEMVERGVTAGADG